MLSIIAAIDKNRCIGNKGKLLYRIPSDLKNFKRLTYGRAVVMGRKTFESIGKPLEGRLNIILTNNRKLKIDNCKVVHHINEVLAMKRSFSEIFIIGGGEVYKAFFDYVDRMYLTKINAEFKGDAFFPNYSPSHWLLTEYQKHLPTVKQPGYDYLVLDRL